MRLQLNSYIVVLYLFDGAEIKDTTATTTRAANSKELDFFAKLKLELGKSLSRELELKFEPVNLLA